MTKRMIIFMILIFTTSFSKIVDNINIFEEPKKELINEKIKKIKETTDNNIYVVTTSGEEKFIPDTYKKTIIINVIKNVEDSKLSIELKFSQDINYENLSTEFGQVLEELDNELRTKNEADTISIALDRIQEILEIYKTSSIESNEVTEDEEKKIELKYIILLVFLVLFVLFNIRVLYVQNLKRKYYKKKKRY